jgi:hypothetical protein
VACVLTFQTWALKVNAGIESKHMVDCVQVRLRELQVTAAVHTCGSFSVVVCSRTLKISDDRASSSAASQAPAIISIGQELPVTSSGLRHVDSLAVRHRFRTSVGSTQQVCSKAIAMPHTFIIILIIRVLDPGTPGLKFLPFFRVWHFFHQPYAYPNSLLRY